MLNVQEFGVNCILRRVTSKMTQTSALYFCRIHKFQKGFVYGLQVLEVAEDKEKCFLLVLLHVYADVAGIIWDVWRGTKQSLVGIVRQ